MCSKNAPAESPNSSDVETKKESAAVKKILATAPKILAKVGQAPIFQKEQTREFPTFTRQELNFGKMLGVGAFGVVREVLKIHYSAQGSDDEADCQSEQEQHSPPTNQLDALASNQLDAHHYDISIAKSRMVKQFMRHGEARYAVKYLKTQDINAEERARGRIDLAIEIQYLHVLNHPNIVKMRGYFDTNGGDRLHPDNFFLMDRLYGTLEDRIEEWKRFLKQHAPKGIFGRLSKNKRFEHHVLTKEVLQERLVVAYDIASAFRYMHLHKLVYRDIKLENIGFDIRGDVKVFDFGLAKSMTPDLLAKNGLYHLTACTGSLPYIAPEVVTRNPYNEKSDVFGFGMLFWEILALKSALDAFPSTIRTRRDYGEVVIKNGCRPAIKSKWPLFTKQLLKTSWLEDIAKRPSMCQICTMMQADLKKMTTDGSIVDRSQHMMQRSTRSWHAIPANF